MKITATVYAKLNLTLDVLGKEGDYHALSSLCTSVSVCDRITAQKRTDGKIVLTCHGLNCPPEQDNAYRAAQAFMQAFPVAGGGVTLSIQKNIPVGGGMGGSSADVVGTLLAMQRLFGVEESVTPLVNALTSDGAFMQRGGTGVLSGRGERVEFLPYVPLYFVLIPQTEGVLARDCFAECDRHVPAPPTTPLAKAALLQGDNAALLRAVKNDLTPAATTLLPAIAGALAALKTTAPLALSMTGSGSVTFGVYPSRAVAEGAKTQLLKDYPSAVVASSTPCGVEIEVFSEKGV